MNIVLAGMKHCGKSTTGAALAARWECPFVDIDRKIEAEYERATGERMTVRDIYKIHGEDYFTKLEVRVVHDLATQLADTDAKHVAALGGPTPMNPEVQEALHELGLVVYLRMPTDKLFERVKRSGIPPFLDPADPERDFASLCAKREPHYLRLADLVVDVDGLGVESVVDLVIRRIEEHTHAR